MRPGKPAAVATAIVLIVAGIVALQVAARIQGEHAQAAVSIPANIAWIVGVCWLLRMLIHRRRNKHEGKSTTRI